MIAWPVASRCLGLGVWPPLRYAAHRLLSHRLLSHHFRGPVARGDAHHHRDPAAIFVGPALLSAQVGQVHDYEKMLVLDEPLWISYAHKRKKKKGEGAHLIAISRRAS